MKATRIISLLVAAFFVVLSPTMASAYTPPGSGVGNNGSEPTGNGCYSTTFTATGKPGDAITFTLTGPGGNVVYSETKTANGDGVATFTVEQCTPGTYTGTATASNGDVLGTSQFVVPGSGDAGGDSGSGSGDEGSLPSTGSSTQDMLALGGGLALLVAGGVALVAVRRRSNA